MLFRGVVFGFVFSSEFCSFVVWMWSGLAWVYGFVLSGAPKGAIAGILVVQWMSRGQAPPLALFRSSSRWTLNVRGSSIQQHTSPVQAPPRAVSGSPLSSEHHVFGAFHPIAHIICSEFSVQQWTLRVRPPPSSTVHHLFRFLHQEACISHYVFLTTRVTSCPGGLSPDESSDTVPNAA